MNIVPWESQTIYPGQEYGRLTILSTHRVKNTYKYLAKVQCDCGSDPKYTRTDSLRNGIVTSCGCFQREQSTKHGNWQHRLYKIWRAMMQRCYNPKDTRYNDYGGRGITVCERWHNLNLFIQEMDKSYQTKLEIDRIDNEKGYGPENCRWSTHAEQARNKRTNIKLTYQGKTLCLAEWSRLTGVPYQTLWGRIRVRRWSVERTLTTPTDQAINTI